MSKWYSGRRRFSMVASGRPRVVGRKVAESPASPARRRWDKAARGSSFSARVSWSSLAERAAGRKYDVCETGVLWRDCVAGAREEC